MASSISDYLGNLILLWLTGTDMPAALENTYLGLWEGPPLVTGGGNPGTEVTTDVRAGGRIAAPFDPPDLVTTNAITNLSDANFGNAASDAVVTYVALHDAQVDGNVLAQCALPVPSLINQGQPVSFPLRSLKFTIGFRMTP